MTARANARLIPLSDRGPVARSMRRYLGRATLTLFAVMLLSAFLLPLLSMVTLSFEQAGQRTTAGAPFYPAAPATGTYQGETYDIYSVPIDGTSRDLMLVTKGRTESTFVDPGDPTQTPIVWQGAWRTLQQAWTVQPEHRQLHDGLVPAQLPQAALQHGRRVRAQHDRGGAVLGAGGLRLRPVQVPGQEHPVRRSSSRRSSCRSR